MTLVGTGPVSQRLEHQASATAVAAGLSTDSTATFIFGYAPPGMRFTGTVAIPDAPPLATFTATVGITPWGEWSGGLPFGPIQIDGRDRLEVSAVGLTAGVTYTAVFVGVADQDDAQLLHPLALASGPIPSHIISPITRVPAAVTFSGPAVDCSTYPAARFTFTNDLAGPNTRIVLTWYDSVSVVGGVFTAGEKSLILGPGGSATCAFAHAGDALQVTMGAVDGVTPLALTWSAEHRTRGEALWNIGNDGYVLAPSSHAFAANGVFTVTTGYGGLYAGPAMVYIDVTSTAGSGSSWMLKALQSDGTFQPFAIAFTTGTPTARTPIPVLIPPATIQLQLTNQTAAANTISYAIVPDDWRLG